VRIGQRLFNGDQLCFLVVNRRGGVNPPKKSKPIVYSTKSHSRRESFEIYDSNYNRELKKLWLNLILEISQDKLHKTKRRKFNEWELMLLKKFGSKLVQIKEEKA
jgi:hypothetical protein